VAAVQIDFMETFNSSYGQIAGDALIRRLAQILVGVGLDTYHDGHNEFLCKGQSRQELRNQLSRGRQLFREPFEIYADGRLQRIEEADFSFGIGTTAEEWQGALRAARNAAARNESPQWLRKIIEMGGPR